MADRRESVDIKKIYIPGRFRKHGQKSIDRMAKNLKERGQFHDIMVTPLPQDSPLRQQGYEYELVEGGLRLAGAKAAGWTQISCLVRENISEGEKSLIMVDENETRDDLTPLEKGNSYLEAMKKNNWNQEQLAEYLGGGKTQTYISQFVVIARQSDKVKEIITSREVIDVSHLEIIMRLGSDEAKIAMIERCVKEDLSVKQLENLVNKVLAASPDPAGQAEAVKKADAGAAPKPKKSGKGKNGRPGEVRIEKTGKVICLIYYFEEGTQPDAVAKPVTDGYQHFLEEQAKADQSKPDPQALKAANEVKKAAKAQIAKLKKSLKTALAHLKSQQTSNRDTSGALKDVESIKADIEAQKLKLKALDKNPAGAAAKLALPVDPGSEKPTSAKPASTEDKQASQLQDITGRGLDNLKKAVDAGLLGDKGKAVLEFNNKTAELNKLQLDHKAAGSEEEKARLAAEIEQKKADIEAIKQTLNSSPLVGEGKGEGIGEHKQPESNAWGVISKGDGLGVREKMFAEFEDKLAKLGQGLAEAKTEEEKAARKAEIKQVRISYNDNRILFGAPPIDFPEIP